MSVPIRATAVPEAAVMPKFATKGWGMKISEASASVVVSEVRTQAGPTRRIALSIAASRSAPALMPFLMENS